MVIRVCVAGVTGWTGSAVARGILSSSDMELTGAIARRSVGRDVGEMVSDRPAGLMITSTINDALLRGADVLVDYTSPESVKARTFEALQHGVRVVIGTSGLTAADYREISEAAAHFGLGVLAAGNFSLTAALAKHCALIAAKYLPSWEIIDYASAEKMDAPSGTTRELAEELNGMAENQHVVPLDRVIGDRAARGASIGRTQVHSIRLPGYIIGFEVQLGQAHERLTIRHDAGASAEPYVAGTLIAIRKVMDVRGLVRGLDHLLFPTSV